MATLTGFLFARITDDWCAISERVGASDSDSIRRDLAEYRAKRGVLELLAPIVDERRLAWDVAESALEQMALPYADHPDYRDEWKPDA